MKEKRIESSFFIENSHKCCGSSGSMNNSMYRNVCVDGTHSSYSGREKTRFQKMYRGVCISQKKKFWEL
jgi:hypothetical protein